MDKAPRLKSGIVFGALFVMAAVVLAADDEPKQQEKSEGSAARKREESATPKKTATKARKAAVNKKSAKNKGNPGPLFSRWDRNGDDKLTREELPEMVASRFATLDRNGDKSISKDEFEQAAAQLRRRLREAPPAGGPAFGGPRTVRHRFIEQDLDADGRLTRQEARGELAEKFASLDRNGDGKLDVHEVENGLAQRE